MMPEKVRFALVPHHPVSPSGAIEWDPQAGTATGPGAEALLELIEMVTGSGSIMVRGMGPVYYTITDPLRRPDEMAVIVFSNWQLPPELAPYFPKFDFPPLPEGVTA